MSAGHGIAAYRRGCRCNECRAANTRRCAAYRAARKGYEPTRIPHGLGGYRNYGCRCEVCSQAQRAGMTAEIDRRRKRHDDAPHGTDSGYAFWGCRCDPCYRAHLSKIQDCAKRKNEHLRSAARRHGQQWTGPELEIASREDLSHRQVAELLGRSYYAVRQQRRKLHEPMPDHIAGVSHRPS